MKYEQLKDQAKDAKNAVQFLPQSMVAAATKKDLGAGRLPSPEIKHDFRSSAPITLKGLGDERDAEERKYVMIAMGVGSIFTLLLVYFLFVR